MENYCALPRSTLQDQYDHDALFPALALDRNYIRRQAKRKLRFATCAISGDNFLFDLKIIQQTIFPDERSQKRIYHRLKRIGHIEMLRQPTD